MEMADASCKQPNIVKLVSDFLKFRQLSVKVFLLLFVVECAKMKWYVPV